MSGREQLGPYTLTWPDGVFPLGADTLALGGFATVRRGWRVCDLGTGSGALLLLLARREAEPMRFPRARLNRNIQNFTPMEASSTTAVTQVNSTADGWMILSREDLASSKPMRMMSTLTARPLKYSNRAWP